MLENLFAPRLREKISPAKKTISREVVHFGLTPQRLRLKDTEMVGICADCAIKPPLYAELFVRYNKEMQSLLSHKDDDIVHHAVETSKHVALGSILGDGYLTPVNGKGSRLWVKYDDKSLDYLHWVRELLKPFGVGEVKKKKGYHQHYFLTDGSAYIAELHLLFYDRDGKKRIPKEIFDLLYHPLALAVWYMDDGNLDWRKKYHNSPTIATYCFTREDCIRLAEVLSKIFGIFAKVHKSTMRGKVYYRLYIEAKSTERFFEIISPYIHPSFLYKLSVGRQQPR
jgi:hypothetical protein